MKKNPRVIDLVVHKDLCIGCGLCTWQCPSKAIGMKWNDSGFLIPEVIGECDCDGECIKVCPFNPVPEETVKTENELADIFLRDHLTQHPRIGKYIGMYAGYAEKFRQGSSSGGIATYVFAELLNRGIVDHVFSVRESQTPGIHYEYLVSSSFEELLSASKTKYYPVTLANVFSVIDQLEGKIVVAGVACFIKAIRLAQHYHPGLKEKIPFLAGIICGGIKSRSFAEYLAGKAGVSKDNYIKPEFRIKDYNTDALNYSFGCIDKSDNQRKTIKMRTLGDMWGTGLFKANACDFCDDVTTELADISIGDAWIDPYINDGRGTNIVVVRSEPASKILMEGLASGDLKLDTLSPEKMLLSQKGSFSHRQDGIHFRMMVKRTHLPKRKFNNLINPGYMLVQLLRMQVRKKSLLLWKNHPDSFLFDKKMSYDLKTISRATTLYHYIDKIYRKSGLIKTAP